MSRTDFSNAYAKHCVRLYGWLPVCKQYKGVRGLKYFTLPGPEAWDVFMLEMEGVLVRDKRGLLTNVFACEEKAECVGDVQRRINPPVENPVIHGNLNEMLLTPITVKPIKEGHNTELRQKQNRIEEAIRLKGYFPFNIINLDPCGELLNHENLEPALREILRLQASIDKFVLFITTTVGTSKRPLVDEKIKKQYQKSISRNKAEHPELVEIFKHRDVDEKRCNKNVVAIGFTKSIILKIAADCGWCCEHGGVFFYESDRGALMMCSICTFTKGDLTEEKYLSEISTLLGSKIKFYPYTEASRNREVTAHLRKIETFRDRR